MKKEQEPKKKIWWKILIKVVVIVLAALLLTVVGYFAYVLIAYHRLPEGAVSVERNQEGEAETGKAYSIVSYNIGFGAYEDDYDFFMDGGTQAWAWSKERLDANLKKIAEVLSNENADFIFVQECDTHSTRTYYVDERPYLTERLFGYSYAFAQNYDSPFLMYPLTQPHGASQSGILTFSTLSAGNAERVALPIETSLYKLLDLDRCFLVERVPVNNGKELVLINFHLSAYTSDGKIADEQVRVVTEYMQREIDKGNYVIACGDFNKSLTENPTADFGTLPAEDYTWAQPFPKEYLTKDILLESPFDAANPIPSCRNPDTAWTHDNSTQFVITIDGFLHSSNIEVQESHVIDTDFAYSDHNPVRMTFTLK